MVCIIRFYISPFKNASQSFSLMKLHGDTQYIMSSLGLITGIPVVMHNIWRSSIPF